MQFDYLPMINKRTKRDARIRQFKEGIESVGLLIAGIITYLLVIAFIIAVAK